MDWKERENSDVFTWDEKSWTDRKYLMSKWIGKDVHSIADFGAGNMSLRNLLREDVAYVPIDYISRTEETVVADFNKYEFPNIFVDCCFCSGVLEYVNDLEWFLDKINQTECRYVLVSYSVKEQNQTIEERRSHAWVNDLTFDELVDLFYRHDLS
jgi:hypothetical protein